VKGLAVALMVVGVLAAAGGALGLATKGGGTPAAVASATPSASPSPPASGSPSSAVSPSPSASAVTETPQQFLPLFAKAIRRGSVVFLLDRLHPVVIDTYGEGQCRTYLQRFRDRTAAYKILSMSARMQYIYSPDGLAIRVDDVFSVRVNRTANGSTSTVIIHLGLVGDQIRWFTDCGTPQ
jgi:hypothetical protein